jgi:hypothetical protein
LGSTEVVLAHYAYLFEGSAAGQRQGASGAKAGLDEDSAALTMALLLEAIDIRLACEVPPDVRFALQDARARLDEPGAAQGLVGILRRLLNAVTTLFDVPGLRRAGQWASGQEMLGALAQVARYLTRREEDTAGSSLDRRLRTAVLEALDDRPGVVVAHSLGSVIAFEALHEAAAEVRLFVTLGSPIAMRTIVLPRLRPVPPATPACVRAWLNFWDRDDLIAARPILERDVTPNSRGVRPSSERVDSDGLWVHPATTYLADAKVAGRIVEALSSTSPTHQPDPSW